MTSIFIHEIVEGQKARQRGPAVEELSRVLSRSRSIKLHFLRHSRRKTVIGLVA